MLDSEFYDLDVTAWFEAAVFRIDTLKVFMVSTLSRFAASAMRYFSPLSVLMLLFSIGNDSAIGIDLLQEPDWAR